MNMSITPTQQRPEWSPLNDTFVSDLLIPDCNIHAGSLSQVEIILDNTNYQSYVEQNSAKDLYFLAGVAPERGMERAGDSDVTRKGHFYIDFDIRTHNPEITDADIKELGAWLGECLSTHEALRNWRYITFTGNGLHVHYFGDPVPISSLKHWQNGMRWLLKEAERCTGMPPDAGCINIARLSRLPGSFNHKNGGCKYVEILEYQDVSISISEVEKMGTRMRKEAKNVASVPDAISLGNRNTTLTSIAGSLRKRGLDADTILESLRGVNNKKCNPSLPDQEVIQIAKSVSRYEPSQGSSVAGKPVLVRISDVEAEEVVWLWQDRIPLGKISMLEGDPGNGKSWCSLAVASAVTLGAPLPGENERGDPGNVLLLTAEDGIADTLRPRLDTMEADLKRIKVLTAVSDEKGKERHLSLTTDLAAVEEALSEGGYALVIIDPLNAYLGATLDTHRDAALRSVLSPLAQLAERHNVAILCIRHLTKSGRDKAIYRGQGSIAYTAAARTALLVGRNPHDGKERVIACIKNNLSEDPPNLAFEIQNGKFTWKGETNITAESMLGPVISEEHQTKLQIAQDFLLEALFNGPQPSKDIENEARDIGITKRTLERARSEMGIEWFREGGNKGKVKLRLPNSAKSNSSKNGRSLNEGPIQELFDE